MQPKGTGI